jgi:[ribosomal protein S18]-alanine N-acetyltransferase
MTLTLRYMRLSDIAHVVNIDRLAFDLPWSARSYAYEISESTYSHMVVLEYTLPRQVNGWRRWLQNLNGRHEVESHIVGYGGLWHILDEAHISTIATHPDWRGRGWGEILLAGMIKRALVLNAGYMVLEVRVSNSVAQNLYHKYGFEVVATKPNYYRNNNEDAYDMRLDLQNSHLRLRFAKQFDELKATHKFIDTYTEAQSPQRSNSN